MRARHLGTSLVIASFLVLVLASAGCYIQEDVSVVPQRQVVVVEHPRAMPPEVQLTISGVKEQVIRCFKRAAQRRLVPPGHKEIKVRASFVRGIMEIESVSGVHSPFFRRCVLGIRASIPSPRGRRFSSKLTFNMDLVTRRAEQ